MNINYSYIVLFLFLVLGKLTLNAQSADPRVGMFCDETTILCNMGEMNMNGVFYSSPDEYDDKDGQPSPLCPGIADDNGQPHNTIWYAFIAEDVDIDLDIRWTNGGGIHAGIYEGCDFDTDSWVACGMSDTNPATIKLQNDSPLEIGRVYYLFIDGINGTNPDYTMTLNHPNPVTSSSFMLDDITSINTSSTGVYCLGIQYDFSIDQNHNGFVYEWSIVNEQNMNILDSVTTSKEMTYDFDEEGTYDITVQSYTACDTTSQTIQVQVGYGAPEVFDTITVCMDCLSSIHDLTKIDPDCITEGDFYGQDPNSDGIGWVDETNVTSEGWYYGEATTSEGCRFIQSIYIAEENSVSGVARDSFFCSLPVTITDASGEAKNFYNNNRFSLDENGNFTNQCSGEFFYTVRELNLDGAFSVDCTNNVVDLIYSIAGVPAERLSYAWYDGTTLISNDGNRLSDVVIDKEYRLVVSYNDGNTSCEVEVFHTLNNDELKPGAPVIDTDQVFCNDLDEIVLFVDFQGDVNYEWVISTADNFDVSYSTPRSDTITIMAKSGNILTDFTFTVEAHNGCANSDVVNGSVSFVEAPEVDFTIPSVICKDSLFTIQNISDASLSNFTWELNGLDNISGDINTAGGEGVFRIANTGTYTIRLTSETDKCTVVEEKEVEVITRPNQPIVTCDDSVANQVVFSWDLQPWMQGFTFQYSPSHNDNFLDDSENGQIIFQNLGSNEAVEVTILFDYGAECGLISATESCTSMDCPPLQVTLRPENDMICFEDNMDLVPIAVDGFSGNGNWLENYVTDGVFDPNQAGVGRHMVTFEFNNGECDRMISTFIEITQQPSFTHIVEYEECPKADADMATVSIFPEGIGSPIYYVDGVEKSDRVFQLATGTYDIQIEDQFGCRSELTTIEIESNPVKTVEIIGEGRIKSFEDNEFIAALNDGFNATQFTWTIDGNPVCNSEELCNPPIDIDNGILELCVVATDGICSDTACMELLVYTPIEIIAPNVFAPLSGSNSQFTLSASTKNVQVMKFEIYDRLGNKMHLLEDFTLSNEVMTPVWDGTYGGKQINPGVYVYILQYLDENGEVTSHASDITVVK